MAAAVVTVRMDADTKSEMESVCRELGMSMSTAFTIFAKKVGRERRIPFDLTLDPFYSPENMEHIRRSLAQLDAGLGVEHDLIMVEDTATTEPHALHTSSQLAQAVQ